MTRTEEHEMVLHLCEEIDRIKDGDDNIVSKMRRIDDLVRESRQAIESEAKS